MMHEDYEDDFFEDQKELSTDEIEALEDRMAKEALESDMLSSYHW